jgi:hypothetical protein
MKKLIYLLALIIPLSAQEAKDDPFHDSVGKETEKEVKEESTGKKVVRTLQDMEWRKFEAAHRRAHSKRGEEHSVRESRGKKHKVRQVVRIIVVGGVAYYIGYHQGQHKKHPMKRKPYMGGRK